MSSKRLIAAVAVALPSMALVSLGANAVPISYTFQVTATSGSLSGTSASGTFTFDSSVIPQVPPQGVGQLLQTGLLTDLDFVWNGIAYTELTANTGLLAFDEVGDLIGFVVGVNAGAGNCVVTLGQENWCFDSGRFGYATPSDTTTLGEGPLSFQPLEAQVPERVNARCQSCTTRCAAPRASSRTIWYLHPCSS